MIKFWTVWKVGGDGGYHFSHSSLESAVKEASRLADKNPNDTYVVFEAQRIVRVPPRVPVEELDLTKDQIFSSGGIKCSK